MHIIPRKEEENEGGKTRLLLPIFNLTNGPSSGPEPEWVGSLTSSVLQLSQFRRTTGIAKVNGWPRHKSTLVVNMVNRAICMYLRISPYICPCHQCYLTTCHQLRTPCYLGIILLASTPLPPCNNAPMPGQVRSKSGLSKTSGTTCFMYIQHPSTCITYCAQKSTRVAHAEVDLWEQASRL